MESAAALLAQTPLFGALREEEREAVLSACRTVHYAKGDAIDNDEGLEWFNILLEGRVKLVQTDPVSGRSFVSFLLDRGDVFDVIALLDGERHVTMPVTLLPTTLLRVPMEEARRWLREYPAFNDALLPYLGEKMRHLEAFAESVIFDDTATRLARLILRHARPVEGEERVLAVDHVSHELLAEMIGSVRSVVTTQLNKLKQEGLILHQRGKIIVENLEGLLHRYSL